MRFKPQKLLSYALLGYELLEVREASVGNNAPPSRKSCLSWKSPCGYHEEEAT